MKKLLLLLFLIIPLNLYAISFHLPTYIITGDKDNQLKYQVNIDHELVKNTNVFMSYTMLAKWNIYDRSSPFQEYNHNPSIFFQLNDLCKLDFIRVIPWEHLSNGLAHSDSRSMDRYFGEAQISYGKIFNFGITEKTGSYYNYSRVPGEYSIRRYLGFFKTTLFMQIKDKHGYFGHERLAITGEWTKRFYWYQIDLTFRIITSKFSPHIYIQYYNGYGEFLHDYYKKTNSIRAGFIFN